MELLALEAQLVLLLQWERQEDAAPDAGGQAVLQWVGGGLCGVLSGNIRSRDVGGLLGGWVLGSRGGEAHGCRSDLWGVEVGGKDVVVVVASLWCLWCLWCLYRYVYIYMQS